MTAPLAVVEIPGGGSIVFEAVDQVTGLPVSGVTVSEQAVTAIDLTGDDDPVKYPSPSPVSGAYVQGEA